MVQIGVVVVVVVVVVAVYNDDVPEVDGGAAVVDGTLREWL